MTEAELLGLSPREAELLGLSPRDVPTGEPRVNLCMTESISSVYSIQIRLCSLFSEMLQGKIAGYRVEMDRGVHPAEFHITTWT